MGTYFYAYGQLLFRTQEDLQQAKRRLEEYWPCGGPYHEESLWLDISGDFSDCEDCPTVLLEVSPMVQDGRIEVEGGGEVWQYLFQDGQVYDLPGSITYADPTPDRLLQPGGEAGPQD